MDWKGLQEKIKNGEIEIEEDPLPKHWVQLFPRWFIEKETMIITERLAESVIQKLRGYSEKSGIPLFILMTKFSECFLQAAEEKVERK